MTTTTAPLVLLRHQQGRQPWSARLGGPTLVLVVPAAALSVGAAAALFPVLVLATVAGGVLVAAVVRRPAVATYVLIAATPLVVGIDRGRLLPLLRPNEALLGLLIGVLVAKTVLLMRFDFRFRLTLGPVATTLVAMAVASSILPMMWMTIRGRTVEMDDITHAAVMWKTLAIFALVRYTIRTQAQVRVCIVISMTVATVVAGLAIAQSLGVLGVRELLTPWYASFGYTEAFADPRAGSTIGLPAAMADFAILNLALAIGLWWKDRRATLFVAAAAIIYVMAVFAAAEFSSALGLLVTMVTVAALLRRLDLLGYGLLVLPAAIYLLWPTVEHRVEEFKTLDGMPRSWLVRLHNLETYFWPDLFSGTNPILGVRPSARAEAPGAFGFVWIESGYTWLLWGGGVFLFGAFVCFVWVTLSTMKRLSRSLTSYSSVAALAAHAAVVMVVVLMIFDPHITYRGFSDALYAVLALALVPPDPTGAPSGVADTAQEARS